MKRITGEIISKNDLNQSDGRAFEIFGMDKKLLHADYAVNKCIEPDRRSATIKLNIQCRVKDVFINYLKCGNDLFTFNFLKKNIWTK
jgi:hypothetical protein